MHMDDVIIIIDISRFMVQSIQLIYSLCFECNVLFMQWSIKLSKVLTATSHCLLLIAMTIIKP